MHTVATISKPMPAIKAGVRPFSATCTLRKATPAQVPRCESQLNKSLMVGGLGAILAAQLSLAPFALAGPDLPFGLNNPIGGDIERTREASQMPANRSDIGKNAAAESQGAQANNLQSTVAKAYGRTQPALSKDGDKKDTIGSTVNRVDNLNQH